MSNIRIYVIAAVSFALAAMSAQAQPPKTPPSATALNTAATTQDFLKTAAASDEFERQSGKMASERSQNSDVKAFGQHMVTAHTESTQELGNAAKAAGQEAPMPQLNAGQEKSLKQLADAKGPDFDKVYLQQQHQAHKEALGLMQTYATGGQEAPLRTAAAKTAPLVQQHLATVASLQINLH